MGSFIQRLPIIIAFLAGFSAHASVVTATFTGLVGTDSFNLANLTDSQGLFGPVGGNLFGKFASITYTYDTTELQSFSMYPNYYVTNPGASSPQIAVTINGITRTYKCTSQGTFTAEFYNDNEGQDYYVFDTFIDNRTENDLYDDVELFVEGIDPHFLSITQPVSLLPLNSSIDLYIMNNEFTPENIIINPNACATVITNGFKGPTLSGGTSISGPTQINAQFTPTLDGTTPYGLANAANLCGVEKFDWVQIIRSAPDPLPLCVNNSSNSYYILANPQPFCEQTPSSSAPFPLHLTSQSAPFYDPPPNGYDYINVEHPGFKYPYNGVWDTGPDAYPFYYDTKTQGLPLPLSLDWPANTDPSGNTLNFSDMPTDPCISDQYGIPGFDYLHFQSIQTQCGNPNQSVFAPPYHVTATNTPIRFSTYLAGVKADNTPLIFGPEFDWQSNFNGTSGGIATTVTVPGQTTDPNGTGGITVTNVNATSSYSYQGGSPVGSTLMTGSQLATRASGLAYSRVTQTFNGSVVITNISNDTLVGPFNVLINSLTPAVTVTGATGQFSGWSYITIPAVTSLAPGQSATLSVQFKNPSNVPITFTPLTFTGSFTN